MQAVGIFALRKRIQFYQLVLVALAFHTIIRQACLVDAVVAVVLDAGAIVAALIKPHVFFDNAGKVASSLDLDYERKVAPILRLEVFCGCADVRASEVACKCYRYWRLTKASGRFKKDTLVAGLDRRLDLG